MALKHEAVVDSWNVLVIGGAGRGEWAIERIDTKLGADVHPPSYSLNL